MGTEKRESDRKVEKLNHNLYLHFTKIIRVTKQMRIRWNWTCSMYGRIEKSHKILVRKCSARGLGEYLNKNVKLKLNLIN
jgi:hypothetical protein